jgi:hypothetical protein
MIRALVAALLLTTGCASRVPTWEVWLVDEDGTARPAFRYRMEDECDLVAHILQRHLPRPDPEPEYPYELPATYECRELR